MREDLGDWGVRVVVEHRKSLVHKAILGSFCLFLIGIWGDYLGDGCACCLTSGKAVPTPDLPPQDSSMARPETRCQE